MTKPPLTPAQRRAKAALIVRSAVAWAVDKLGHSAAAELLADCIEETRELRREQAMIAALKHGRRAASR